MNDREGQGREETPSPHREQRFFQAFAPWLLASVILLASSVLSALSVFLNSRGLKLMSKRGQLAETNYPTPPQPTTPNSVTPAKPIPRTRSSQGCRTKRPQENGERDRDAGEIIRREGRRKKRQEAKAEAMARQDEAKARWFAGGGRKRF